MPSIIIIGAERGLGLGLAEEFFARGWAVTGTARPGDAADDLRAIGAPDPSRLTLAAVDVTDPTGIAPFLTTLGARRFDVVFSNAGIWGPLHQSAAEATAAEVTEVMMTNTFGPIRLAHHLLGHLSESGGTLAFMSSHRGSIASDYEGGLELYRASKAALNMLARGIYSQNRARSLTVLSLHPGWAATRMGTLDGTVSAEMEIGPSVHGVADVVERHRGSGENLYRDWQDRSLDW